MFHLGLKLFLTKQRDLRYISADDHNVFFPWVRVYRVHLLYIWSDVDRTVISYKIGVL